MKLNGVTVESGYLVIHTNDGIRRQSMKWRGVEQLRAKALSLVGKNIRTTTSGTWDPSIWFATIDEVRSAPPSTHLPGPAVVPETVLPMITTLKMNIQNAPAVSVTQKNFVAMDISALILEAESGDMEAQFALAQRYDKGEGTSRSILKAMAWYQQAAEQGHKASLQVLNGEASDVISSSGNLVKSVGLVTKIFGPPGTGKTTTLLKHVKDALESGVPPDQIGYFSFTNKATEEAKDRMVKGFPQYAVETDFPYFQTLHSLANQALRTRVNLLSEDQALEFDKDVLIDRPMMREGDESSRVVRVKHPILDAATTARSIKQPFAEYLQSMPTSQRWTLNKWLGHRYSQWENPFQTTAIARFSEYLVRFEKYKDSLGVIDYADMLERAMDQSENLPQFELLIVDEAQDLTPIQWDIVRVLISRAKVTYVAGDDDQAICESFGARASEFVAFESNQDDVVLNESHRVPPGVHGKLPPLVERLNQRFPFRKDKSWMPKRSGHQGLVTHVESESKLLEEVLLWNRPQQNKSFLLMFPTNASLNRFSDLLRHNLIDHYAANELIGAQPSNLRLQTIWGAKGGEADYAALVQSSDMDRKMLKEDPRLEYVAVTRAMEVFYYVGFPMPALKKVPELSAISPLEKTATSPLSTDSVDRFADKFRRSGAQKGVINMESPLSATPKLLPSPFLLSSVVLAGFDEGLAAANKGDFATALGEWAPIAEQGNSAAQFNLGYIFHEGLGVSQDFAEAIKWFRLAANQGEVAALRNIGYMYKAGQGVTQDFREAEKWLRLAADKGYAKAQLDLGRMYDKEAERLYRLAAEQGDSDAQVELGWRLGGPVDIEAVKWFRMAAEQGDWLAQVLLGFMYEEGTTLQKNNILAYALYNISAANYPSEPNLAAESRDQLSLTMSAMATEFAQNLSREMNKSGNLLKELDKHAKDPNVIDLGEKKLPSVSKPTVTRDRSWERQAASLYFDGNSSLMSDSEFEMIHGYER